MSHYMVNIDGKEFEVKLEKQTDGFKVIINNKEVHAVANRLGESRTLLLVDNIANEIDVRSNGYDSIRKVFLKGQEIEVNIEDYNLAQLRKTAGMSSDIKVDKILKSPMPGLVLEIKVNKGDQVKKNQSLVIIEAMKMENVLKAAVDGVIKDIYVKNNDSVEKADKLLEFE